MKNYRVVLRYMLSIIIIFVFFLIGNINVSAEEEGIGFTVETIKPSTQIDPNKGYFYVQTEPSKEQTLKVRIQSTTDETLQLETFVENAISTNVGNIDYSDSLDLIGTTLIEPLTTLLVPKEKSIVLEPHSSIIIEYILNPSSTNYEGIKMGRIIVREKIQGKKNGIQEVFQYGLTVHLSESGLIFNDGETVKMTQKPRANVNKGLRVIEAEISNPESKTIENLQIQSYITRKGERRKIKERNIDDVSFAPDSKVLYQIPLGLSEFEPGEYTFYYNARNSKMNTIFEEDFSIGSEESKKLNNETAFSVNTTNRMKIIIITINTIAFILILFIIFRNNRWSVLLKK